MPPIAKSPAKRQRTNRTSTATTIEASPAAHVELVAWLPKVELHPMTIRTWDVWWASPLRTEWVDADVPDLVAVALLVDAFWWASPSDRPKIHGEIRMASREFGLTPMSRRGLQWEVKRVESVSRPAAARSPTRRRTRTVLSALQGGRSA